MPFLCCRLIIILLSISVLTLTLAKVCPHSCLITNKLLYTSFYQSQYSLFILLFHINQSTLFITSIKVLVSELKMMNFIYFQFLSHFYFIFCLFLFWEPELEFGMTQCHTLVTVTWHCHGHTITQSHVMMENSRQF